MKYIIFFVIAIMVVLVTKPVQAVSFQTKYLVSSFSINPLVNAASSVYPNSAYIEFTPTDRSKAQGTGELFEASGGLETKISTNFSNLEPNGQYVVVYHHNQTCEIEVDTLDNVIQGAFIADESGKGKAEDQVKDRLSKINSISVRSSGNFKTILACAKV